MFSAFHEKIWKDAVWDMIENFSLLTQSYLTFHWDMKDTQHAHEVPRLNNLE